MLKAVEYLLSGKKTIAGEEYYSTIDEETKETKPVGNTITLEAEFRNLPVEASTWRGFKGRIFNYTVDSEGDTGLSVTYKKTFEFGKEVVTLVSG